MKKPLLFRSMAILLWSLASAMVGGIIGLMNLVACLLFAAAMYLENKRK